ncbi:MAG: D-alanyl-D-alanine carboxypeptidase [Paracoccaceae bacterium]|nr:D-alanyl-D-alanine carboxypeptidase [Paracoccaceae bacterium]
MRQSIEQRVFRPLLIFRVAIAALLVALCVSGASASQYAAMVMDARTGEVLHSRNADTRLHPASLTKMMTLYVAFQAVEGGEIGLDTRVKVSRNAAGEPPSKLGLRAGQRISVRHLIRATAVRSANDAATALGEAISGSEAAFIRRMTATARLMGMTKTNFKNAHGLTQSGHLSSARDMTILGRRLLYDFPEYYNLFSRPTADAGVARVRNTNRRLLSSYRGADGIKTGYTRASGFSLVASARRDNVRIIATVFGGKTAARRDRRVAELLEMGFQRAPRSASVAALPPIFAVGPDGNRILARNTPGLRPRHRPASILDRYVVGALGDELDDASDATKLAAASGETGEAGLVMAEGDTDADVTPPELPTVLTTVVIERPRPAPNRIVEDYRSARVVSQRQDPSNRNWRAVVGHHANWHAAEKRLMTTVLRWSGSFVRARRTVELVNEKGRQRYQARFDGLSESEAKDFCTLLRAQNEFCEPIGPPV